MYMSPCHAHTPAMRPRSREGGAGRIHGDGFDSRCPNDPRPKIRYSRRIVSLVRATGTAALLGTVSFACPNDSLEKQQMETVWNQKAQNLCCRIRADYRNHQMLADPWSNRAHIIVQGWRNIASQGRLNPNLQPKTKVTTWNQSAERMRTRIHSRRQSRMLDKSTWRYWASHLSQVNLRYIPKRKRKGGGQLAKST